MYRFTILIAFFIFLGCGQGDAVVHISNPDQPEDILLENNLKKHLLFLSSDSLRGRKTGEVGADIAADYIAEQFESAGVKTLDGADGYMQKVPFAQLGAMPSDTKLTLDSTDFNELVLLEGDEFDATLPLAYVGYGLSQTDYDSVHVTGKMVVVRGDSPNNEYGLTAGGRKKLALAAKNGARAMIMLYSGSTAWQNIQRFISRDRMVLDNVGANIPYLWLNDRQTGLQGQFEAGNGPRKGTLSSAGRPKTFISSNNVIGLIEGADPNLKNEYVLLTAHYDHIGVGRSVDGDSIYNGARDNAMGVVALIAAAKALQNNPPARSVLILAVTAEEIGLLGSRFYADNPLIPLNQTIFNLNIDGAGYTDTSIVTVIGLNRTSAAGELMASARAFGLEAIDDPVPDQGLFDRSDNVSFAVKGIPSPTFSPGFRGFTAELMKYYHQPADEANEDFDYAYLLRFCQAYARAGRLIANMEEAPTWNIGDHYEAAGKALYSN